MLRPVHLMFMLLPGTTVLPQHAPWAEDARLATRDRLLSIASEAVTEPPGNFHLPERVDLRPFLPPPGDQGRQHSSIAWALAYGLKSFQENLQREAGPLDSVGLRDPRNVFSPAFAYNLTRNGTDTADSLCSGSYFEEIFSVLVERGCCTWDRFPYDTARWGCSRPVPDPLMPIARSHVMATPLRVSTEDITMLRYHLAINEPVAFAMGIDSAFRYGDPAADQGAPMDWRPACEQPMPGSHAMLLVGYDDADSTFLVMNSWGTTWGDGGFCRLRYGVFSCHATEAYVANDALPDLRPAAPLLVPGRKPLSGPSAKTELAMGEAVVFNDLTVGLAHLAGEARRASITVRDRTGSVKVGRLDLVEGRPVRFHQGDTLVTIAFDRTSKPSDPRNARAQLRLMAEPGAKDPILERALMQAARIREAREMGR